MTTPTHPRPVASATAGRTSFRQGPADEIIYYLQGPRRKEALTRDFLACLERELAKRPEVQSLLRSEP